MAIPVPPRGREINSFVTLTNPLSGQRHWPQTPVNKGFAVKWPMQGHEPMVKIRVFSHLCLCLPNSVGTVFA
ncbi:MAG: hypothetical protein ABW092_03240 [Candidatus Thiodiazotropha sp.]